MNKYLAALVGLLGASLLVICLIVFKLAAIILPILFIWVIVFLIIYNMTKKKTIIIEGEYREP